jgi:hypothetical protein
LPQESGDPGDALRKIIEWYLGGGRRTRGTPVLIDFADDIGYLFGRPLATRIGK